MRKMVFQTFVAHQHLHNKIPDTRIFLFARKKIFFQLPPNRNAHRSMPRGNKAGLTQTARPAREELKKRDSKWSGSKILQINLQVKQFLSSGSVSNIAKKNHAPAKAQRKHSRESMAQSLCFNSAFAGGLASLPALKLSRNILTHLKYSDTFCAYEL